MAENMLVHVIDIGMAGGAAFLIGRGGKGVAVGLVLAIIYLMAIVGGFLGDTPVDYFGPTAAVVAALVFGLIGWRARKRLPTNVSD